MTLNGQINACLRELNILRDMIHNKHESNWDLGWELDQIEHAKICLFRLQEGEGNG